MTVVDKMAAQNGANISPHSARWKTWMIQDKTPCAVQTICISSTEQKWQIEKPTAMMSVNCVVYLMTGESVFSLHSHTTAVPTPSSYCVPDCKSKRGLQGRWVQNHPSEGSSTLIPFLELNCVINSPTCTIIYLLKATEIYMW